MRFGVAVPRPSVQADRDVREPGVLQILGLLAEPGLGAGVGEDVAAFGDTHVGGDGNDGNAGDEAAGHREHRCRRRHGQHRDQARPTDTLGDRRRGPDEIASTEHGLPDRDRVGDVGAAGDRGGVQGGQQHADEATRHDWAILGPWIGFGRCRRARCTGTTG